MSGQLQGRIALVTGSATGIGEAIARRFAAEGASVMFHGRKNEIKDLEKLVDETPGSAYIIGQVDDPIVCEILVETTVQRFGSIDIVVNNAAAIVRSNLATTDAATFDYVVAVNVRAPLLVIRAAHPYFKKAGGGCVLNIGSVNAYCGEGNQLAYSVAKGGLMTMTRNLSDALALDRVRVNQINPGWVLTPNEYALKIKEGLPADWPEHLPKAYAPSGRILKPEEVAHYALTLCSDAGGPVSGAVIELEQYSIIGRNPVKESL